MASRHFQKCYRSIPGWHHVRTNLYPNISVLKTFGRCRVLFISIPLRVRIIHVGCSHYQSIVSYLTLWRINLTLRRNWYKIKQVLLIKRIKIKCHFGKITPSNSLPQIFSWLWQTFSIKTMGFLCYIYGEATYLFTGNFLKIFYCFTSAIDHKFFSMAEEIRSRIMIYIAQTWFHC